MGTVGVFSVMGRTSGLPYVAHVLLYTRRLTPNFCIVSRTITVLLVMLW